MIRSRLRLWFYFIVVFAGFELETGFFQSDLFVHVPRLLILLLQSERGEEDMPDLMEAFRGQLRALPGEFGGKCACRGVVSNKCLPQTVPGQGPGNGGFGRNHPVVRKPLGGLYHAVTARELCDLVLALFGQRFEDRIRAGFGGGRRQTLFGIQFLDVLFVSLYIGPQRVLLE